MIKATKLDLEITEKDYEEVDKIIRNIQYETKRALNSCMTYQYKDTEGRFILQNHYFDQIYETYKNTSDDICCKCKLTKEVEKNGKNEIEFKLKSKDIVLPKSEEIYGKTLSGYLYDRAKEQMHIANTAIIASVSDMAQKQFKTDIKKGVLKGDCAISSFKKDCPIPIPARNIHISKNKKGDFSIDLSLLNKNKQKEYDKKKFGFKVNKPDGNKKAILNRILDGTYTLKESKIINNKRPKKKRKWMLAISFEIPKKANNEKVNIMGIDIGINNVIAFAVFNPETQDYVRVPYNHALFAGDTIDEFRTQMRTRRHDLSSASKVCRSGKGYRRKCKTLNSLKEKEKNFRDTFNHKVSKYVIDMATKYDCGLIQMEDLSGGFADGENKVLNAKLKNWAYYDLQTKTEYKAEEVGISTVKIDPQYTSKRCSHCGHINTELTSEKKWDCPSCGEKNINRDLNAARNIVLPDIEEILLSQMKLQGIEPIKTKKKKAKKKVNNKKKEKKVA